MLIRKFSAALSAVSLAFAPIAAQAGPRASAPVNEESELGDVGGVDLFFIGLAAAVIIWAVLEHVGDDDPVSP